MATSVIVDHTGEIVEMMLVLVYGTRVEVEYEIDVAVLVIVVDGVGATIVDVVEYVTCVDDQLVVVVVQVTESAQP